MTLFDATRDALASDLAELRERLSVAVRAFTDGPGTVPEADNADRAVLLSHVLAAFESQTRVRAEIILARMAEDHPSRYQTWDVFTLGRVLARYDVSSVQMWDGADRSNRRGYRRADVIAATSDAPSRSRAVARS